MSELKPCPFCGGEAIINKHENTGGMTYYVARCDSDVSTCLAETQGWTREEAINAWNTRAERTCKGCVWEGRYASLACRTCGRNYDNYERW